MSKYIQNNSRTKGKEGEDIAREFLIKNGYTILQTNWRYKKLEVDIIANKDGTVVFVEVKTRENSNFGEPEVFVDKKKQNFLVAAANEYLCQNEIDAEARFDVVSVLSGNNNPTVKHLEAAFYPDIK